MGFVVQVGKGGRLVIPAEIRKQLGLGPGDSVLINQVCGGISMIPCARPSAAPRKRSGAMFPRVFLSWTN